MKNHEPFNNIIAEVSCGVITLNPHSWIQNSNLTTCPDATTVPCLYEESVTIECDPGYGTSLGQTSVTLTCQENKTFTNTPPICNGMFLIVIFYLILKPNYSLNCLSKVQMFKTLIWSKFQSGFTIYLNLIKYILGSSDNQFEGEKIWQQ